MPRKIIRMETGSADAETLLGLLTAQLGEERLARLLEVATERGHTGATLAAAAAARVKLAADAPGYAELLTIRAIQEAGLAATDADASRFRAAVKPAPAPATEPQPAPAPTE